MALSDYLRLLEFGPGDAMAHNNVALIQFELGMHESAIERLDAAIHLRSEVGYFYFNRALNYDKLGDRVTAENDLKKAAELGVRRAREILYSRETN